MHMIPFLLIRNVIYVIIGYYSLYKDERPTENNVGYRQWAKGMAMLIIAPSLLFVILVGISENIALSILGCLLMYPLVILPLMRLRKWHWR